MWRCVPKATTFEHGLSRTEPFLPAQHLRRIQFEHKSSSIFRRTKGKYKRKIKHLPGRRDVCVCVQQHSTDTSQCSAPFHLPYCRKIHPKSMPALSFDGIIVDRCVVVSSSLSSLAVLLFSYTPKSFLASV